MKHRTEHTDIDGWKTCPTCIGQRRNDALALGLLPDNPLFHEIERLRERITYLEEKYERRY